jgi:transcriptional regulator with XRE-family HTH domain
VKQYWVLYNVCRELNIASRILYNVCREPNIASHILYNFLSMALALTHALPSNSLESAVRMHFGLAQIELARYLGVSAGQVAHYEAGRRRASATVNKRLERLARWLPPPEGTGLVAPTFKVVVVPEAPVAGALVAELPDLSPLAAAPLQKRQREVGVQAAGLRWALHREGKRMALQGRRQWGLAVLQAALPTEAVDVAERTHIAQWLHTLAADVMAAAPSPAVRARRALTVARLLALDVEAAALAHLLAAG